MCKSSWSFGAAFAVIVAIFTAILSSQGGLG
jgi:hypothetical protein